VKNLAKIAFQVLVGSENPTRACFPFLQAVAQKERGDEVTIALAAEGVVLIRDAVINSLTPVGWPPLKETFQKIKDYGVPIYV
jgi:predicted peroxiredoxin